MERKKRSNRTMAPCDVGFETLYLTLISDLCCSNSVFNKLVFCSVPCTGTKTNTSTNTCIVDGKGIKEMSIYINIFSFHGNHSNNHVMHMLFSGLVYVVSIKYIQIHQCFVPLSIQESVLLLYIVQVCANKLYYSESASDLITCYFKYLPFKNVLIKEKKNFKFSKKRFSCLCLSCVNCGLCSHLLMLRILRVRNH